MGGSVAWLVVLSLGCVVGRWFCWARAKPNQHSPVIPWNAEYSSLGVVNVSRSWLVFHLHRFSRHPCFPVHWGGLNSDAGSQQSVCTRDQKSSARSSHGHGYALPVSTKSRNSPLGTNVPLLDLTLFGVSTMRTARPAARSRRRERCAQSWRRRRRRCGRPAAAGRRRWWLGALEKRVVGPWACHIMGSRKRGPLKLTPKCRPPPPAE